MVALNGTARWLEERKPIRRNGNYFPSAVMGASDGVGACAGGAAGAVLATGVVLAAADVVIKGD